MSQNIRSIPLGAVFYQSGNGYPTHIATRGCTYIDVDTGIEYINRDGLVYWVAFLDSTYVITGGTSGNYLPLSGGTVTGPTQFTNGLTATTISATTYLNLPPATFSGGTVTGPTNFLAGLATTTISATTYYGDGSNLTGIITTFTGGTVSGPTQFTNGLTANTISATTYQNLPLDIRVTGGTYSDGTSTFTNNTGGTFSVSGFSTATQFTGGTVTGATNFTNGLTANTISATTITGLTTNVNELRFNTEYTGGTIGEGIMFWDEDNGSVSLGMHGGVVSQQIGLESYYYIKNQSGSTIENGRVVRAVGTLGSSGRLLGEYMIANGSIPAKYTLGVAAEDIVNGDDGYVTEFGLVRGIDTTGSLYGETWVDGDILFVSPTIFGGLTKIEPQAPLLKIEVAIVIHSNSNGSLFVRPNRYPYMNDIQNVSVTGATEGDLLTFIDSGNNIWHNSKILNGSYTITGNTNIGLGLTATTISATTYQNLPPDIRVTGGTYSAGTAVYTNNTGGTFSLSGFSTAINFSGGSVSGLTANTISATTYQNLPIDVRVTGGTYSAGTAVYTNNTGGTFSVSGFSTGTTNSITQFTGGTVSGATVFAGGLTANTISATTYQNLPLDIRVTGGTYSDGTSTFTNNTGGTFSVSGFSTAINFSGGTVTGATNFTNGLTANTISATTYFNMPPASFTGGTVTGPTQFTNGLSANTISATTYFNIPPSTFSGGTVTGPTNFTNGLTATTISATTYLNLPSGSAYSITPVTATTYTETITSGENIILCNTTSNNITVNLPTAIGNTSKLTIKRISAGTNILTVDGNASETIDGGATAIINKQYEAITLISDNSNWWII